MYNSLNRLLKRGIPIYSWLPHYNSEKAISDLIAGFTIGLTLIPQSLAYAALAGLSAEYGLYSSLCGGFVYTIFGTIPQLNIAPTALISLLTYSYTHHASFGPVPAAVLLCLASGLIELLCGLLHLGFLIDFVSTPVVAGFTSAGAVTIASAQVKNLIGLKFSAESFVEIWINVVDNITEIQKWDAILSFLCCFVLLFLRHLKNYGLPPSDADTPSKCKIFMWFLSVSRNAIVVIFCAVMAFVFEMHDMKPFSLSTKVQPGLPNIALPTLSISNNNETVTILDMLKELGSGIAVVPFVSILGNVAIAKAFAQGKVVDASQEMIAVGLCNIVGCFVSSMPVNASFSRAAVSNASGIRTSFGGIYTGTMVILALAFLTPYFSYIPKATLASVIICAVLFMVEVSIIKPIWKINKIDWIPLWGTFISCLFLGIELGILIGVGIDLVILLYYNARPNVVIEIVSKNNLEYLKVTPSSAVLFPSAEYVREKIMDSTAKFPRACSLVVLDCSCISRADYTFGRCAAALANDLKAKDQTLILYNIEPHLARMFLKASTMSIKLAGSENELNDILKNHIQPSKTSLDTKIEDSVEINIKNNDKYNATSSL